MEKKNHLTLKEVNYFWQIFVFFSACLPTVLIHTLFLLFWVRLVLKHTFSIMKQLMNTQSRCSFFQIRNSSKILWHFEIITRFNYVENLIECQSWAYFYAIDFNSLPCTYWYARVFLKKNCLLSINKFFYIYVYIFLNYIIIIYL